VGIFSPNHVDYAAVFYGALLAGTTVTTLNPLHRERRSSTNWTTPRRSPLRLQPHGGAGGSGSPPAPRLRHVWPMDELSESVGDVPEECRPAPINPREDVAVLPYSSGTTGLPKGVMLTHYNISCNVKQSLAARNLTSDMVSLCVLPFFHIYGMTVLLGAGLALGATGIVDDALSTRRQMLHLVESTR